MGCGGTGGWVVPHVARMVKSLGVGSLAIADGDLVETKNLGRQNFVAADLGLNKALALAKRYSGAFGIPIRAIPGFLEDVRGLERQSPNVIIGCVDKHKARRMIAEYMARTHECVWIDSGNETVAGQVVMGYTGTQFRSGMRASGPIAAALPTISQMLDLPVGGEVRPSCAEMQEVTAQVSSVNVWAASICANFCRLVLEDVKRSALHEPVKGVSHHGIYFNCENGGFSTLWNTPEALQKARAPMCPWNVR
ncbi:MAG TPA: ThiF family adenylyltransferase [Candidatus Methylomirabilis sp.]|nr:ThiF family adenylyltransferase [Candidatus Methylomirabilis sp.]